MVDVAQFTIKITAMENMITQEEKEQITKWVSYLNNGHLANPNDIVNLYNKIFDGKRRKQSYTRCSSCLIRYVKEMKQELDKQELEEMKQKEDILEAIDSFMMEDDNLIEEKQTKKKGGRPKKSWICSF